MDWLLQSDKELKGLTDKEVKELTDSQSFDCSTQLFNFNHVFCCSLFFKVNMLDLFYRKFLWIRYSFWINKPMRCFAISFLRTAMFCYPFESNLSNLTVCRLANFHKFEFSFSNEVIIALSRLTFMREAHSPDHSGDFILCLFYFILYSP